MGFELYMAGGALALALLYRVPEFLETRSDGARGGSTPSAAVVGDNVSTAAPDKNSKDTKAPLLSGHSTSPTAAPEEAGRQVHPIVVTEVVQTMPSASVLSEPPTSCVLSQRNSNLQQQCPPSTSCHRPASALKGTSGAASTVANRRKPRQVTLCMEKNVMVSPSK